MMEETKFCQKCGGLLDERSVGGVCSDCKRYTKQIILTYLMSVLVISGCALFLLFYLFR